MAQKGGLNSENRQRGRKKGSLNKVHGDIKDEIRRAFTRLQDGEHNGRGISWLDHVAWNNPAVFAGLVAKIIPQEVQLDVTHNINLSDAMAEASQRLIALNNETAHLIDVTPTYEDLDNDNKELAAISEDDDDADNNNL